MEVTPAGAKGKTDRLERPRRSVVRGGFALLDLAVLGLVLALNGLLISYIFSLFSGPAPWYAWATCAAVLPIEALVLGTISLAADRRAAERQRP